MDSELDDLRRYISKLQQAADAVEDQLRTDFPSTDPFLLKDMFGRFMLLDAMTALVFSKAVLLNALSFDDD